MPLALPDEFHRGRVRRSEVPVLTPTSTDTRDADLGLDETGPDRVGPYRLATYTSLVSSNDVAMARLCDGDPGGLMIRAVRQTGGRGRQGRVWQSPVGNLYASLALRLDVAPAIAPQLGFVAGVALASVLRGRLGGDMRLRIKWPNDMIFAGAKLSGLLLESASLSEGRIGCVIGFGVNCRSHPEGLPYPATDLAVCGDPAPDPAGLLGELAESFAARLGQWNLGCGFAEIRAAWLRLAVDDGTPLAVALPGRRLTGVFRGLDETGRLLVETAAGHEAVDAGDVFLTPTDMT